MEEKIKVPFWQSVWFVVIMLLLLPPVGIVLLWIGGDFKKNQKIIATVAACLYALLVFPFFVAAAAAPFAEKEIPKQEAIIGEWELSREKSGTTSDVSNLRFDEDGLFIWAATSEFGVKPVSGTFIKGEQITLIVGAGMPIKVDYSIDDDVLKFDGLYYTRGKNLDFREVTPETLEVIRANDQAE